MTELSRIPGAIREARAALKLCRQVIVGVETHGGLSGPRFEVRHMRAGFELWDGSNGQQTSVLNDMLESQARLQLLANLKAIEPELVQRIPNLKRDAAAQVAALCGEAE